jgi:hypothetical protein
MMGGIVRSVNIYCHKGAIRGFFSFNKEGKPIWSIGYMTGIVETVMLSDKEVIIGVAAKLFKHYQSVYTDLQFQIAAR